MIIHNADHRLAIALKHGATCYLADAILRHPASRQLDHKFETRLGALAEGALPSMTDAQRARRCAATILASELGVAA